MPAAGGTGGGSCSWPIGYLTRNLRQTWQPISHSSKNRAKSHAVPALLPPLCPAGPPAAGRNTRRGLLHPPPRGCTLSGPRSRPPPDHRLGLWLMQVSGRPPAATCAALVARTVVCPLPAKGRPASRRGRLPVHDRVPQLDRWCQSLARQAVTGLPRNGTTLTGTPSPPLPCFAPQGGHRERPARC